MQIDNYLVYSVLSIFSNAQFSLAFIKKRQQRHDENCENINANNKIYNNILDDRNHVRLFVGLA